ncbi:MAG TPA: serine/threonine-protein kinase [Gemmatimonadaceae bacterium]|nr:serine/threonine-protein kinase [Gemmatimonadaceae bacterium]
MNDTVATLQTGIGTRYRIEREIGRGGMATVFLATDLDEERQVAIKVLLQDLSMALGPERFRREIQLASRLSHPNILPLYDWGEANGSLYYVMPFVAGESLAARLKRERQLSVAEAVRITCEAAQALEHAHRQGFIHRDIKPDNILLQDGMAIVADFGIARAISESGDEKLTQTGLTLGTPTYMSPEQALAERQLDGRSDVYSLGCVLYEMLAGQPPFVGPTAQAIIARQMLDEVPSLTVVRGSIPDEVEDAVLRALSKVPADRFATAAEFADALQASMASGGRSLGRRDRRARPRRGQASRRRRLYVTVAAAALLPVLGAAGWVGWRRFGERSTQSVSNGAVALASKPIAVLYFRDASSDHSLGYLADGLTESLIATLERVPSLHVISANGVAPFRGDNVRPDSVARALDAGALVRGAVECVGDQLHVSYHLMSGASGADFADGSFDMPVGDPLAARDSLAQQVARLIREQLGAQIQVREERAGTRNVAAWTLLQQARRAWKDGDARMAADDSDGAAAAFAQADSLLAAGEAADAHWAAPIVARAELAYHRSRLAEEPPEILHWVGVGLGHATRALAIDSMDAAAREVRGTLDYWKLVSGLEPDPAAQQRLLTSAQRDLEQATQLDPTRASAWSVLSHLYYRTNDVARANIAAQRAYEQDAYLSAAADVLWRLQQTSYDLQNFTQAAHWCDVGHERFPANPRFVECQLWVMGTNAVPAAPDRAWWLADTLVALTPQREREYRRSEAQMLVAAVLWRVNLVDSARHVLVHARTTPAVDPTLDLVAIEAAVRTMIGDKDEAINLLTRYLAANPEHREGFATQNYWWWQPLREDPRYIALVGIQR